jgi:DNA recombination-dependent growth factor C
VCTYALQIIQSVQLRAQSTVDTQKLLVHNRSQRKGAESVHASFVDSLGVLVLALELESEVISQMTALVISAEQPERVGIPDFQRPKVKNAL